MARKEQFKVSDNINFMSMFGGEQASQDNNTKEEIHKASQVNNTTSEEKEEPQNTSEVEETVLQEVPKAQEEMNTPSNEVNSYEPKETVNTEITAPIRFSTKNKDNRSVHKNFLLTSSTAEKLASLASSMGVSQNAIVNDILEQVFASMNL